MANQNQHQFQSNIEGGLYTTEKLHLTAGKPKFWPAKSEKRGYFRWNKSLSALDAYSMSMIPHNFSFTEFEALESNLQNIQLTANVIICNVTATNVMIESGWHYLACPRCSKKVLDDNGDLWCTKCEVKVDMPIARYMLRFKWKITLAPQFSWHWISRSKNWSDNAKVTVMSGFRRLWFAFLTALEDKIEFLS
ncbi:hypothetical protein C5167_013259 [Papaver somniferum]|uniref:Replication factor A C-terminal domain-containing protein n=1 Tax=Papaver somniferum TaxID=3469 RepID=A0A4Y7J2W7_PAPSO|nr:hypothetical protein C5167_013259 [Papaver somniferum]